MMNLIGLLPERFSPAVCGRIRAQFSAYLDGELSGRSMAQIAIHMDGCTGCRTEFAAWREMSDGLSKAGRVAPPADLQARLRGAVQKERLAHTHLSAPRRLALVWERNVGPVLRETVGPMALRATAGLLVAASLLGGLTWMNAGPLSVEANDDNLAHLSAPHYLYSEVPPQAIITRNDAPILIDAKVDAQGRIYDFNILEGPSDPAIRLAVEKNLLASIFRPATVFGEPVRGHVMLTFAGVSVRG